LITNYQEAESFLNSFINYEKLPFFSYQGALKLKRVLWLFAQLKIPHQKLRLVHIAGTKGKGSTAWFCASLLRASGYKVGLYTSPHFFDFRERVKVNQKMISKKELIKIAARFRKKLASLKIPKKLGQVSFFEIYTALAFRYFLDQKVDFAVLETGLGGRLDATNIAKSSLPIITHIGYDHTQILGSSLSRIAQAKAGIIKNQAKVITQNQQPEVLSIIKKTCLVKKAKLFVSGKDFKVTNLKLKPNYTVFDFTWGKNKLTDLKLLALGKHQTENAACALAACYLLPKIKLNNKIARQALKNSKLWGRFEVLKKKPLIIADIAHNLSSFSVLRKSLDLYFPGKKIILIFGCSEDKDAQAMLKEINYSSLILTKSANSRAADPKGIKRVGSLNQVDIMGNVKKAIEKALKLYRKDCLILISGSLFLVAEAKKHV
jgi:dihydrofolate synthase/folylpolyglutamate synthase